MDGADIDIAADAQAQRQLDAIVDALRRRIPGQAITAENAAAVIAAVLDALSAQNAALWALLKTVKP